MDKRILDVVSDFGRWKGDMYRLASQVAEQQREIDAEKLENAALPEAAEIVRTD
jgi:hypothetical protein